MATAALVASLLARQTPRPCPRSTRDCPPPISIRHPRCSQLRATELGGGWCSYVIRAPPHHPPGNTRARFCVDDSLTRRLVPHAKRVRAPARCRRLAPRCSLLSLPLGRLLPRHRGLRPLAGPGYPDYHPPSYRLRLAGREGSAPLYPETQGWSVGGRAGPPIIYGHPVGRARVQLLRASRPPLPSRRGTP